jgi:beta-lactam-binding protein with PASTA domain
MGLSATSASGQALVSVPRLTESNLARALVRIHRAGLRVTVPVSFYLASNSIPQVGRQNPQSGETVPAGTAVVLKLYQPPTVAPFATTRAIRVPKLTGLRLTYAVKRLEGAGLRFWTVEHVPPLKGRNVRTLFGAYRVTAQHPTAGRIFKQRRQVGGVERVFPVALSVQRATLRR